MTALYLHVGHSKTGTTWLQAVLSLSRERLAAHGLTYPETEPPRARDSATIGLGNAPQLARSADSLRTGLAAIGRRPGGRGVIFSSEELFPQLLGLPDPDSLGGIARACGFDAVRILLMCRDPLGHATSLWQQYLKRGGGTASVEEFFARYAVPERVAEFLDRYGDRPDTTVTLRNYTRWQDRLLDGLADWLDLPHAAFTTPSVGRLNRSLTRGELAIQRALNRHLGKGGRVFSDALCERLPDIAPDDLRPALAVQDATWRRLGPAVARVNARLPAREHYRCDRRAATADPAACALTLEQAATIGDALGAEIAWLRLQLAALGCDHKEKIN